jgi:DNA-directed RNA polymerase alpha subunit
MNCLESENINTVRDLVTKSPTNCSKWRNFGETTLNEVREKLTSLGLRLGMRLPAARVGASKRADFELFLRNCGHATSKKRSYFRT